MSGFACERYRKRERERERERARDVKIRTQPRTRRGEMPREPVPAAVRAAEKKERGWMERKKKEKSARRFSTFTSLLHPFTPPFSPRTRAAPPTTHSHSLTMGDRPTDHLEPAAKKRGSDRQLTREAGDGSGSEDEVREDEREGPFFLAPPTLRTLPAAGDGLGGGRGGARFAQPRERRVFSLACLRPRSPPLSPRPTLSLSPFLRPAPTRAPLPARPRPC